VHVHFVQHVHEFMPSSAPSAAEEILLQLQLVEVTTQDCGCLAHACAAAAAAAAGVDGGVASGGPACAGVCCLWWRGPRGCAAGQVPGADHSGSGGAQEHGEGGTEARHASTLCKPCTAASESRWQGEHCILCIVCPANAMMCQLAHHGSLSTFDITQLWSISA
jgi:hypothetical protein